jgi:anhydro-N-acetylmuramic acid kinase
MKLISLGIMSGTSLDGVDLALCRFKENKGIWKYDILDAVTVPYTTNWESKLRSAHRLNVQDFLLLHNEYGKYIGNLAKQFLEKKPAPDIISSHGHTIFHQPENGFTFQLGNGAAIAANTHITTISDFRSLDVALGGQGAPLVPVGDELLFREYDYCLNLGGIANISFDQNNERKAYDICPVNQVLNHLASQKHKLYDKDGEIGASGKIDISLLNSLNSLDYYSQKYPKSLSREWIEQNINTLLTDSAISTEDQLATFYEHISYQISRSVFTNGKIMVTGGGAKNKFLIKKLFEKLSCEIVIPDDQLIDFKEALIFAFLGVLRFTGRLNCFASVTGAKTDSIAGTIYSIS